MAVAVAAHLEVINRREVHLLHPSKHTCVIFSVGVGKEKKPYFVFSAASRFASQRKINVPLFFVKRSYMRKLKKKIQRFYPRERDMHHAHACKTLESLMLEVD